MKYSTAQLTISHLNLFSQTIATLCGLNKSTGFARTAHVELDLRTAHLAVANNASSQQNSAEQSPNSSKFRGAGAILNSRLVHSGWKFLDFVLTERDERWLLDVQVRRYRFPLWLNFLPSIISNHTYLCRSK